jgi:hypothetical protein
VIRLPRLDVQFEVLLPGEEYRLGLVENAKNILVASTAHELPSYFTTFFCKGFWRGIPHLPTAIGSRKSMLHADVSLTKAQIAVQCHQVAHAWPSVTNLRRTEPSGLFLYFTATFCKDFWRYPLFAFQSMLHKERRQALWERDQQRLHLQISSERDAPLVIKMF